MSKKKVEDSIHLRAVRYGVKYPHGFSFGKIEKWYKTERPNDWKVVRKFLLLALSNNDKALNQVTPYILLEKAEAGNEGTSQFILTYEAYFNYLNYLELVESRKNARGAFWIAFVAITISVVAMGASIYYSRKQIDAPVKIDEQQFQQLIQTRL